ncbi:methyltransferase domain-containing protein [Aeromicrobium terrae]|uniref:Methyltransferase domain-containing protein n=1 Tax=Aeromicrobium terrae TaxID=2498846 RepID=A0A5C8NI98_9ACTN|nr:methyltransferase domain-containing protein [Aeromicrobium terrae]TXL60625.1 methyltransferase domain-containing protein [Aeromicrobium terrae]
MNESGVLSTEAAPGGRTGAERTATWMVGERLSCVLHMGDSSLAYLLADQGHEVVIAGDDVTGVRHPEIQYVKSQGERLPFISDVFDVVIAPELRDAPVALAEYARVLMPGGLLSTVTRTYDSSIPWMRKLREIVGDWSPAHTPADTFTASGLFEEPETNEFGTWEELDLAGLLRFAEQTKHPSVGDDAMARVHELFTSYGAQTGTLRLRHQTHCLRARVVKENLAREEAPPDATLIELG